MTVETTLKHFPDRWRLSRAGMINVWHYLENTFDLAGGRMILRGTNGSGKSRAMEMLLPFLLDADRRKMDATGSGRVTLDELMRTGADGQSNRTGYLWLELQAGSEFLTVGALIKYGASARQIQPPSYFITELRVGADLPLLGPHREPLPRDGLIELIGADAVTESPETHRERIRTEVFGLRGDNGRDRYRGLLQLLHTLRAPDVGNRIEEGRLPQILGDSLPPLDEQTLTRAGDQLDGLTTLREAQQQHEATLSRLQALLRVYRRYAATVIADVADAAQHASDEVATAERVATELAVEVERLGEAAAAKESDLSAGETRLAGLDSAIVGLRAKDIFKRADDLRQRDATVDSRRVTADATADEAERERGLHARSVEASNRRLTDLRDAVTDGAADLTAAREALRVSRLGDSALADQLTLEDRPAEPTVVSIRPSREDDPVPHTRPTAHAATIRPTDLAGLQTAAESAADAATKRGDLAQHRLDEARRLAADEAEVRRLEERAGAVQQRADDESAAAADAAAVRDDAAADLAQGWRGWVADPDTGDLFGSIDWPNDPSVGPLLVDLEALSGDAADDGLERLDEVAHRTAQPARDALTRDRMIIDNEAEADDWHRAELQDEADRLRDAQDPEPAAPPWLTADPDGEPLWRAVDFADALSASERAGLEGALLAAGLLTARIEPDGRLRAEDGSTVLSPGRPADRPVTEVLQPDPAAGTDPELVGAVLAGIGLDDASSTTVGLDGDWRHGPLRGRYAPEVARHIGAAAREQARRQRLTEIDAELADLTRRAQDRDARRAAIADRERRIQQLLDRAPRTRELELARAQASTAAARAAEAVARAAEAQREAEAARTRWAAESRTHHSVCDHHDLPADVAALADAVRHLGEARRACDRLASTCKQLVRRVDQHQSALGEVDTAAERCREAELRAETRRQQWYDLSVEVAAMHDAIDLSVEEATRELERLERDRRSEQAAIEEAHREHTELRAELSAAHERGRHAGDTVEGAREALTAAARRFNSHLDLPGLVTSVPDAAIPAIDDLGSADAVRTAAQTARSAINRPSQPVDENAVLRAFQIFDREVAGQLDAQYTVTDGVAVINIGGAGDATTLPGAAASLTERVAAGKAALSEREREVFTQFILGGVAEELRHRINQATRLIGAMNDSLTSIRTSNGIGVRLAWRMSEDDADLHRVAELVRTADAIRTTAQNDELTELLRRRVDAAYELDPSSGYATHLATALDYRSWHEVEVTILGPGSEQRRRLSRRAKLSQGETRFVSYVTLFAAADGYLSGLSDTGRQLRLILLDDAFAKVDDPTIGDLMGLLVRLDLDFVMTGHALWGCFPQVPALDVYEVRRDEGTAAITTHIHWDGRTRHLRTV